MTENDSFWPTKELFQLEASALSAAREKTRLIHHPKNIRSSGDEVEEAVRDFFEEGWQNAAESGKDI